MITLLRATERHHDRRREQEVWHTFARAVEAPSEEPSEASSRADGFAALAALDESRLPPDGDIRRQPHREGEIVTYVREGALAQEDSTGRSGVVHAGEFQCRPAGRDARRRERNASPTDPAHVFQLCIGARPSGIEARHEQKRFSTAQRRGGLCIVASPDGRGGSLHVDQDALMYSALLSAGQHVVHELSAARSAWLHVVEGEVTFDGLVLTSGDGAGITAERAVSLTAREETEILLIDLGGLPANRRAGGAS